MSNSEQSRILGQRATAFAMLADASRMERDLIVSRKPAGHGARAGAPEVICLAEQARLLYEERRRRERYLPAGLFGEPAWDLLLSLFIESARGSALSTTAACAASLAPESTALRWIGALRDEGLVETITLATDNRRRDLRLTQKGIEAMFDLLSGLDPHAGVSMPTLPPSQHTGSTGDPARKPWKTPQLESLVISRKLAGSNRSE